MEILHVSSYRINVDKIHFLNLFFMWNYLTTYPGLKSYILSVLRLTLRLSGSIKKFGSNLLLPGPQQKRKLSRYINSYFWKAKGILGLGWKQQPNKIPHQAYYTALPLRIPHHTPITLLHYAHLAYHTC